MSAEVLEVDSDSDIEVTFENVVPTPKPPPFVPFPPYHQRMIPYVKRQSQTFIPKPCAFCRREFRDKITVVRHTVRHHWRAVREQNYGKGSDKKSMKYYDLPDGREIRSEWTGSREERAYKSRLEASQDGAPPPALSPPSSPSRPSPLKLRSAAACLGEVHPPLPPVPPAGASQQPLLPPAGQGPSQFERDAALLEARDLLQHANTCLRREREAGLEGDPPPTCYNSHCPSMKRVLEHIPACREGPSCTFQHCVMAKGIISMSRKAMRRLAASNTASEPIDLTESDSPEKPPSNGAAMEGTGQSNGISDPTPGPSNGSGDAVVVPSNGTSSNQNTSSEQENSSIAINGTTNGAPKPRPKPKTQREEYLEMLAREKEKEPEGIGEGGGEKSKSEDVSTAEEGKNVVVTEPPSGPVDVLSGILSSQSAMGEVRKSAGPLVVDTKQGKLEVTGRSLGSIQYRGAQYSNGDFVYVRPEGGGESQIHRMEKLLEQEGIRSVLGRRFYRGAMETFHAPDRTFYEKEVARSSLHEVFPISRVLGKCYVMPLKYHHTHRPEGVEEKDVYVCEWNYHPKTRQWEKCNEVWKPPQGMKIIPRGSPLEAKRMEESQHAKRKNKPITIPVSEEKSDVLSGILGNLTQPSKPRAPSIKPVPIPPGINVSSVPQGINVTSVPQVPVPRVFDPVPPPHRSPAEAPSKPAPGSDLLSGLLASGGLTMTKRNLPPGPKPMATGQDAANFNSMFSL